MSLRPEPPQRPERDRTGVAIVLVGDELLLGDVADVNTEWLARRLDAAGLRVTSTFVASDDLVATVTALLRAIEDAPSVIVTGGLGPTSDDRTREALSVLSGRPLWTHPEMAADVRSHLRSRGRGEPAAESPMAQAPEGAGRLANPAGTAPGLRVEVRDAVVYALPGVPREVRAMLPLAVLPELVARAGAQPGTARSSLRLAGIGESQAAARLVDVEKAVAADPGASIAYLPGPALLEVRLAVHRPSETEARRSLQVYVGAAVGALGEDLYGQDEDTLASVVIGSLVARQATCATAESLTGGLVGAAITDIPGSSAAFRGAVVAYATELKAQLLGVPPAHLAERGAVDPSTAVLMAEGVRDRLAATYGLATTGVAGPDPQESHPPGTVHVAVAGPGGHRVRSLELPGDREFVRRLTVVLALDLLRRELAVPRGEVGEPRGEVSDAES